MTGLCWPLLRTARRHAPHRRTNQTFTMWVITASLSSIAPTSGQYCQGSGVKPRAPPTQQTRSQYLGKAETN